MNSNLKENWIAGGLLINTPSRLITIYMINIPLENLLSKFQNIFKNFIFFDSECKNEMEDKILNSFLVKQKEPLNKQNSLTCYYSTYLRFLKDFLVTTTTTQGVSFHQYIIK